MRTEKAMLSLAGEYAVASELCRRGIYAQPTFGKQKKMDLLTFDLITNKMLKFEVKSKQGFSFPNCRGISGDNVLLVFVDYQGKKLDERPDFYILGSEDWLNLLHTVLGDKIAKGEVKIDDENCPVWVKQIVKNTGKPYKGHSTSTEQIQRYKERWDKIVKMLAR